MKRLPGISSLFASSRPSQVAWFVVSVIVYAVKSSARFTVMRQFSHVIMERFKVMTPFVAEGNAAPAIVGVIARARIGASLNHACPRTVKRMIGQSVFHISGCGLLAIDAATRLGCSRKQRMRDDDSFIATVAFADPQSPRPPALGRTRDDGETTKPLPWLNRVNDMPFDKSLWLSDCIPVKCKVRVRNRNVFAASTLAFTVWLKQAMLGDPRGVFSYVFGKVWGIIGVHENLLFSCQAWDVSSVARHFALVRTGVSIAHLVEYRNEVTA